MKRLVLSVPLMLAAMAWSAPGAGGSTPAPPAARGTTGRAPAASRIVPDWRAWDDGMSRARTGNRPVIVDVYTDWCGWCRRMDRDVYGSAEVTDYLKKNFVTIKLNAEAGDAASYEGRRYTYASLADRFRISGYPATIFLRSSGQHLATLPGYVPPERFLLLLRYVAEGYADRNMPFGEFEKRASAGTLPR